MIETVAIAVAGVASVAAGCRAVRRHLRMHSPLGMSKRDRLAIEAMLRAAAVDESARLHRRVANYVSSDAVGYVTDIDDTDRGLALQLSDGNRIALNGVAVRSRRLVAAHVEADQIRPMSVVRDGLTYRLRFAAHHGSQLEFHARRVTLQQSSR